MEKLEPILQAHLDESFAMYDELIASLTSDDLRQKLPVPSNVIGAQLWCVVGARESWARAIEKGAWSGFSCSITSPAEMVRTEVMGQALVSSAAAVREASRTVPNDEKRTDLKLHLLVHESQHQGQILRYLLGLRIEVPPSWKARFALGPSAT
ncbi:MAG: hypothetical protein ACRDFW_02005 [bacterium]